MFPLHQAAQPRPRPALEWSMRDLVVPGGGNPEKFYTLGEVAKLLNVSRTTVYRWRLRGLGVVRISGVVRIGEPSLRQFIAHHHTLGEQANGA